MKNLIKKCLILVIVSLCFTLTLSNTSIFAATVVPTDYKTVYTNTNNDITDEMDNNFGVFKFTNYGARFLKVTLTATSSQTVTYPNGAISVKNSDYQLVEKLDITGFDTYAINSENSSFLYVFLESSGSYYVEINYNMTNITKLQLNISVVNSTTSFDNFNYSASEEFTTTFIDNSSGVEGATQFTIKQATQFNLNVLLDNEQSSAVRIIIFKINSANSEELIESKVNQLIYDDYSTNVNLIEGTYCIAYFGLSNNNEIDISLTRNITGYGSGVLVPDPDHATNCGSQITVEEEDIIWYNRSYRQNNITEGFTRLIYLDSSAPSLSRLDYYWYSSDEDVAIITDYGTILALPISTTQETVKVMAVYKNDMSKCYVKEFVVKNDTSTYSSDPIDIYLDMTAQTSQYISIDLSNLAVPVNILQYYNWTISSGGYVDGWGRVYAYNSSLGQTLTITGTYNYNSKVKIHIDALVVLPLSGYELDYNESLWDDDVEGYNNCYAYALNNQTIPGTNSLWYMQQPGEYGNSMEYEYSNEEKMYNAVLKDFKEYNESFDTNLTFTRIGKYTKCPAGTYKVALVACSDNWDYHWYRQDSDGYWSHKPGRTPVRRYDAAGNLIVDPETCDWGIYDVFLGFYAVTGWNNMYDESTELMLYTLEQITSNTNGYISNHQIINLEIGMTNSQVIQILGFEGEDIGSGTLIQKYNTENDEVLIIQYKFAKNNFIVTNIIIE